MQYNSVPLKYFVLFMNVQILNTYFNTINAVRIKEKIICLSETNEKSSFEIVFYKRKKVTYLEII